MSLPSKREKSGLPPEPPLREPKPLLIFAVVFLISFILFGILSVSTGRDNNWDLRNYHYYNPYAFLHGRLGFDYAPAQLQSFLNPTQDLLFYSLVTHLKPVWAGFFMGAIHGLGFAFIFAIAFHLLSAKTFPLRVGLSLLCAAVGVYGAVFLCELGASENDLLTSLFVLASLLILIRRMTQHDTLTGGGGFLSLILAGIILGFAVGMKLTVIIYAVGTAVALFFVERQWKNRFLVTGLWGLAFIVGFAISAGHWMATLWSAYGNPLFPFYNHIFQSPYFELMELSDKRYLPQSLLQGLLYPFHFLSRTHFTYLSYDFRDARYAVIYVLAVLYLLSILLRRVLTPKAGKRSKKKEAQSPKKRVQLSGSEKFLLLFFLSSYIVWQVQFSIIRYLAPLEALAPLIIVILAMHIFPASKLQSLSSGAALTIASAVLIIAAIVKPVYHERLPWSATFFEVEAPRLEDPNHTLVVIAHDRPWAYLIPSFQPGVRFVSVRNNLTAPNRPTQLQSELRALLQGHQGPMYLLSRREYLREDADEILKFYELSLKSSEGQSVRSKHERDGLFLWPVIRSQR
ncbi:MAG: hypothetical protein V1784_09295 [bacterium]